MPSSCHASTTGHTTLCPVTTNSPPESHCKAISAYILTENVNGSQPQATNLNRKKEFRHPKAYSVAVLCEQMLTFLVGFCKTRQHLHLVGLTQRTKQKGSVVLETCTDTGEMTNRMKLLATIHRKKALWPGGLQHLHIILNQI